MTLVEKNNYRLHTITKIEDVSLSEGVKFTDRPISEGVSLEKKCEGTGSYLVIAFIRYNEEKACVVLELVEHRIDLIDKEDWPIVHSMIEAASHLLEINYKYTTFEENGVPQ